MNPAHKYLQELKLVLDTDKFTGNDPIILFHNLTRCVKETDTFSMCEEQVYVLLPQFLMNPAAAQFITVQARCIYSGVTCWIEAVKCLLQIYATTSAIGNACYILQNISRLTAEAEV